VTITVALAAADTSGLDVSPPSDTWNHRWQIVANVTVDNVVQRLTITGATDENDTGRCSVVKSIAAIPVAP
jgi:hypothetical protein